MGTLFDGRSFDIGRFFAGGLELQQKEAQYAASEQKWSYWQAIGSYKAIISEYKPALAAFDQLSRKRKPLAAASPLNDYKAVPAVEAIEKLAATHQIIFINEAHHVPRHRAFTKQLLAKLYRKGFRYFAAETLDEVDQELNQRKYPLEKSGTYSHEPVYGDLLRTALKIGYTLVPYETTVECEETEAEPNKCIKVREQEQAKNLFNRTLAQDPKAKILVHAGYDHIKKDVFFEGVPSMAVYFQQLSGVTPFSIDQVGMMEHSSTEYENPLLADAVKQNLFAQPSFFQAKDGSYFVEEQNRKSYNAQLFQPPSQYQNGRPTWLLENGQRFFQKIPASWCRGSFPCLVRARIASEDAQAVPLDQVVVPAADRLPALVLPKGTFHIQVLNQSGKVINETEIKVK
ncbi:MAG: hypothetical protein K1Y36_10110 [Blastocatellia bacterium]|nr:hypothetical protein [Blastocatellia bacterium]